MERYGGDGHGQSLGQVYPNSTRKAYPWIPNSQYFLSARTQFLYVFLPMDAQTWPKPLFLGFYLLFFVILVEKLIHVDLVLVFSFSLFKERGLIT